MRRTQPPEPSAAPKVREQLERLRAHAAVSSATPERIVRALLGAAARLLDTRDPLAMETRRALLATTGLSAPMIEWGLTTTLASLKPDILLSLAKDAAAKHGPSKDAAAERAPNKDVAAKHAPNKDAAARQAPNSEVPRSVAKDDAAAKHAPNSELIAVVLAGNVFVAAIRALTLPLLAGAHVLAKAASDDLALAQAWKRALDLADPEIGARLELTYFTRGDAAAGSTLCAQVEALSIYGDDDSVRTLSEYASSTCRIIPHGHGLSAAYITREALENPDAARGAALKLALDVAAYDQRGCLSPQFVLIEPGGTISPREFARILAEDALPALERELPRGTTQNDAANLQWEAVAAVRGELFRAPTHAVSFEGEHSPRPSPGGRLIAAYSCNGLPALQTQLQPFTQHLKQLGVAASPETRASLANAISSANVCPTGEMQTPAFDAYADGQHPLAGLFPSQR